MFPVSKEAIVNTMAARVAGVDVDRQTLDMSRMIREQSFDQLQHSFMQRMYGWWWKVSVNVAGVMGVIYLLVLVRGIISTILNGTFLYRTFGCGMKLFAAIFGTLAKYMLLQEHFHRHAHDQEGDQEQDGETQALSDLAPRPSFPADESVPRMYPRPSTS